MTECPVHTVTGNLHSKQLKGTYPTVKILLTNRRHWLKREQNSSVNLFRPGALCRDKLILCHRLLSAGFHRAKSLTLVLKVAILEPISMISLTSPNFKVYRQDRVDAT